MISVSITRAHYYPHEFLSSNALLLFILVETLDNKSNECAYLEIYIAHRYLKMVV